MIEPSLIEVHRERAEGRERSEDDDQSQPPRARVCDARTRPMAGAVVRVDLPSRPYMAIRLQTATDTESV